MFSPNDEGLAAPLHIFTHHGINNKNINNNHTSNLTINNVDETMEEEDAETPLSMMDSARFND
jgi:hypothetical protein